jgi:hypothetical protein
MFQTGAAKIIGRSLLLAICYGSAWVSYDAGAEATPDLPLTMTLSTTLGLPLHILSWITAIVSVGTFLMVMASFKRSSPHQ